MKGKTVFTYALTCLWSDPCSLSQRLQEFHYDRFIHHIDRNG